MRHKWLRCILLILFLTSCVIMKNLAHFIPHRYNEGIRMNSILFWHNVMGRHWPVLLGPDWMGYLFSCSQSWNRCTKSFKIITMIHQEKLLENKQHLRLFSNPSWVIGYCLGKMKQIKWVQHLGAMWELLYRAKETKRREYQPPSWNSPHIKEERSNGESR